MPNGNQFGLPGRDEDTITKCTILANTHVTPALGARMLRELSADDVDRWLADKAKALSTSTLTPRELRQSFVSLLSDAGVPVEKIARLVGHIGTATTELVYRKQIRPVGHGWR